MYALTAPVAAEAVSQRVVDQVHLEVFVLGGCLLCVSCAYSSITCCNRASNITATSSIECLIGVLIWATM